MNKITAVIIEDEEYNRELIRSLVKKLNGNFSIEGEASGVAEGYELIKKVKPKVVFLDIKMGDGVGFDLLKMFSEITFEVVFITGFDEYALKAFEYNALDYVLKPINLTKFSQTLLKVETRVTSNLNDYENLKRIVGNYSENSAVITKIPVHYNDQVLLIDLTEIAYVKAQEGYTCFYKSQGEKYLTSKQLSDFDFIFEALPIFVRVSKSNYVNINFIASYSKGFAPVITMKDGSTHEISRRKKKLILDALNGKKLIE